MNVENQKIRTLEYISYILAAIAVIVGLASVFTTGVVAEAHDKAILWFAFAFLAILIPYVREVTFKDLRVVIDKINSASENLDGATITVKELNNRLNATRDELIDGYQELLRSLPEENRNERVKKLTALYLQEMGMEVTTIKKWLVDVGHSITALDDTMDDEYLTALRSTQQAYGLGDDGIFGYRTLKLMNELRSGTTNTR